HVGASNGATGNAGPAAAADAAADGRAGSHIVAALTSPDLADILRVTIMASEAEARAAVDEDRADVAVIIPAGVTDSLRGVGSVGGANESGSAAATAPAVEIYKDPAATIGPGIVAAVVQAVTQSLEGARAAALAAAGL